MGWSASERVIAVAVTSCADRICNFAAAAYHMHCCVWNVAEAYSMACLSMVRPALFIEQDRELARMQENNSHGQSTAAIESNRLLGKKRISR